MSYTEKPAVLSAGFSFFEPKLTPLSVPASLREATLRGQFLCYSEFTIGGKMGSDILESVRKSNGLSQSALARKTKTFQANISSIESGKTDPGISTLEQCLAPLGYSLIAVPTRTPSVSQISLKIAEAVSRNQNSRAYRLIIQLSDNLKALTPELCLTLSVTPPSLTGDSRYDALIAATVEYHLLENNLPIPAWIRDIERKLHKPESFDIYEKDLKKLAARTPRAFRRHNVLIDKSELASI